jgi:ABC-type antimicrobial peptide transport system permease subunit
LNPRVLAPLRTVVLARSFATGHAVFNDEVGIVGYRLVRWLRSTLPASALMVAVVAVVASVPLALAAGARRTGSAPERYLQALPVPLDVKANQAEGPSLERAIAALSAVSAVRSVTFVFGVISPGGPEQALNDGLVFAGSAAATGDQVVSGREPEHGRRDEFVASREYAEEHGFSLGDTVHLYTLTPEQRAETGFSGPLRNEPTLDGVLVGLVDGPADLSDPTGSVVFGASLLDDAQIATSGSEYGIDLAGGASIADLRAQLDTIDGGNLLRLAPSAAVGPDVRRAIDAQALSLWILAGLAGLVTIVGLGQLLVRHARLSTAETSALSSLGATRAQLAGETAARAAVLAAVAAALAAVVAVAASDIFPFGFVREVEPDPGRHGDALILALGAVVLVLGIVGWVMLVTRLRRSAVPSRRPAGVGAIAARCPTSAMATGVRFAFTSRDATSRLGGVVLMAAGVVGTLVFAVSVERLVDEPARYGVNYDAQIDDGSERIPPDQLAVLESDPAIADVNYYRSSTTRVEGTGATLAVAGVERMRGLLDPPLLAGRLPAGPEEIAIGRISADELDASIGDVLTLSGPAGAAGYQITGLIVPPLIRENDQVGVGGLVTSVGFRRLDPDVGPQTALFRLRPDPSPDDVERLTAVFGAPPEFSRPPAIRNEARTTYVPFVLTVLLAVLTVLLVVNGAYTAVRHRNHEVAVMRSLGAERNWLVRVVNWLAVTSTLVPAVLGVPLGFIVGRLVFRAYADGLGTVNGAVTPALLVALGLAVLVLLAAVAATTAGRTARRLVPARLLHVE